MKAGMNSRILFRAVSVFSAVAAIGCALLLIQNRRMRAELAARLVTKETSGEASDAAAILENARPAAERSLAAEPAPEPIVPAAAVDVQELRQPLIHALMLVGPAEQTRALKQLGVEPRADDFRRALGNLGDSIQDLRKVMKLVRQWGALDREAAAAWVMELGESERKQGLARPIHE